MEAPQSSKWVDFACYALVRFSVDRRRPRLPVRAWLQSAIRLVCRRSVVGVLDNGNPRVRDWPSHLHGSNGCRCSDGARDCMLRVGHGDGDHLLCPAHGKSQRIFQRRLDGGNQGNREALVGARNELRERRRAPLTVSSGLVKSQLTKKRRPVGLITTLDERDLEPPQRAIGVKCDAADGETSQFIAAPTVSSDRQTRSLTVERRSKGIRVRPDVQRLPWRRDEIKIP